MTFYVLCGCAVKKLLSHTNVWT